MFFEPKKVVLRDERTKNDSRRLAVRHQPNGDLIFEGQDIGAGVGALFGVNEYEWTWTIEARDIPKLMQTLNTRRKLMTAIRRRFSGPDAARIESFLRDSTVPFSVWNRVGD